MEVAIGLIVLAVAVGAIIASNVRAKARRKNVLGLIADAIQGTAFASTVTGKRAGIDLIFRFETRGSGSSAETWTEIDVELPRYPLSIYVRKHGWLDKGRIERGEMIDLQLGDEAFDKAFLVEAAPADVARILLDAPTRSFLMSYELPTELTTVPGEPVKLRFAVRTWLEDRDAALLAIDRTARFASRVREAFTTADQAIPTEQTGGPYRPVVDDQRARDAANARVREVAEVEGLRAAREARAKLISGIVIGVVFVVVLIALAR